VRLDLPVDRAFLFGSYAKGNATELSDVDICFFLKDYHGKRRTDLIAQILGIGGEKYSGVGFEPIVFETSEIGRDNTFVREILATGVELL
jgi:predicted nucleotidyltransferase